MKDRYREISVLYKINNTLVFAVLHFAKTIPQELSVANNVVEFSITGASNIMIDTDLLDVIQC